MNTKHTPGPWYEYDMGWAGQTAIAVKHGNANFLIVPALNKGANARLIAAAPELLEACQDLLAAWELMIKSYGYIPENEPIDAMNQRARAAIAKATGESI